ncbi:MAG: glycogen debranching N-terminal domain-containing protein [Actinomycetales bacterium]
MSAWTPDREPSGVDGGSVTVVEGSSFCISTAGGDLIGSGPQGLFFRDTRILSRWQLTVDGEQPEPLGALTPEPYRATFVGRLPRRSGRTDTNLLVERERLVGNGIREDLRIRNPGAEAAACRVSVAVEADFADLFEVKDGRIQARGERASDASDGRLVLEHSWRGSRRGAVVEVPGASSVTAVSRTQSAGVVQYDVVVPPRGAWSVSLVVRPVLDGEEIEASFPLDRPLKESLPARRLQQWNMTTPIATTGHEGLQQVLRRSQQDLGSLRIFDKDDPSMAAVAAGAPWFMALFGRDSLLTAAMALPVDRRLALGTLRTLARHQGRVVDPVTEEEPGRILHEVRLGVESALSLGGGNIYYGTVDATPLFVFVLGELARWGAAPEEVQELLPHADRALDWIDRYGDRDGDGFVEYQRATDRGLRNQGWKDSWDGVTFADGRVAEPPIALCEVQGYAYQAFQARADLAGDFGDEETAQYWSQRADVLRAAFNEQFWLPDKGYYALALDRDKKPVDSCASNMGHCLWTGIVDGDKAAAVVEHLMSPAMFTGWGVRTLSAEMGAYDPVSYHNGSVWPHDNALIVAGLVRYGFVKEAQQLAESLLDAAQQFPGGRLPELFCGLARDEFAQPVAYPTSCSPQAWAAATPIQLIRSLLRFEPRLPRRSLRVAPVLPPSFIPLLVDGIALGDGRICLEVTEHGSRVTGLPRGVEVRLDDLDPHGALSGRG